MLSFGFSASLIFLVRSSRRRAAANARTSGKTGSQAFVMSVVKRVQPSVASKASRSIRSTFFRLPTSSSLISSTVRFSVMVLRSLRQSWMSSALYEALVPAAVAAVTAADRLASASLTLVAKKPAIPIRLKPTITGTHHHWPHEPRYHRERGMTAAPQRPPHRQQHQSEDINPNTDHSLDSRALVGMSERCRIPRIHHQP